MGRLFADAIDWIKPTPGELGWRIEGALCRLPTLTFPPPHIIRSQYEHDMTAIFLAGRGCLAEEFAKTFMSGRNSEGDYADELYGFCKFIFLNGPLRWVEKFGENQPEWFDLDSTSNPHQEEDRQDAGLLESIVYVNKFINRELLTIPPERIIIGGHSQGCAVAMHVLLAHAGCRPFGGFLGFSGWMPFLEVTQECAESDEPELYQHASTGTALERPFYKTETPVFLTHSRADATIDVEHARAASEVLKLIGFQVDYMELETGEHSDIEAPEVFDKVRRMFNAPEVTDFHGLQPWEASGLNCHEDLTVLEVI